MGFLLTCENAKWCDLEYVADDPGDYTSMLSFIGPFILKRLVCPAYTAFGVSIVDVVS